MIDDLAHGRVTGKALGVRHVTADLTALARVKFDVAGQRPERYRLAYREIGQTRDIIAFGLRDPTRELPNRRRSPQRVIVQPRHPSRHDQD